MKTWNGATPFDRSVWNRGIDDEGRTGCRIDGYRAAMNSPEVRAMYEAVGALLGWVLFELEQQWSSDGANDKDVQSAKVALAAYEAGLKE